ncbi:MAG: ribonuclease P protein component [Acidobacteria bacterium]|nr:ribonuclease P protein component [Acidobacteriota bacterium]
MSAPSERPRPSSNPPAEPRSAASGGFPKSSRILKSGDFRRVYDQGIRFSTRLFTAFCLDIADPGRATGPRIGFTVPRAVGKSVQRNRIRRRMREAWRAEVCAVAPQWDVVLNPRRTVLDAPFDDLRNEVRKLVSKCKLS